MQFFSYEILVESISEEMLVVYFLRDTNYRLLEINLISSLEPQSLISQIQP